MKENKEVDASAERLIERNKIVLLNIIARICSITTSNAQDEFELQEAMRIAKSGLAEITLHQIGEF